MVEATRRDDLGLVWLHGPGDYDLFRRDVAVASGLELPVEPLRAAGDERRAALWLAPDQWWLVLPRPEAEDLAAAIRARAAGPLVWCEVVSDGWCWRELAGAGRHDLLAAGCPLDLADRAFPVGRVAHSLLGKAGVTIWRPAADRFLIATEASLDVYVNVWLDRIRQDLR